MKILVLGASQGTGALVVKAALDRGHQVTAFARSPQKLKLEHANLTRLVGDFHDAASVRDAVAGHDAVVVTVSVSKLGDFKKQPNYFSLGTGHTIEAMKAHGVRKLVVLSALGTGETRSLLPLPLRWLLVDFILKAPFADHERQEARVFASGLDFVIARPSGLHDRAASGRTVVTTENKWVPTQIARAAVAGFMVDACEKPTWDGHAVQLGG
jgi:uncharacterized protein YbjT (DUF2867 family)